MTKPPAKPLPIGLYEIPVSRALADALRAIAPCQATLAPLSPDMAPIVLTRALHDRLQHSFAALRSEDRLERQVELANRIISLLAAEVAAGGASPEDELVHPPEMLLAITATPSGGLGATADPERPLIPLSTSDLLINAPHDLRVGPEIRRELASADRVDLLCSFLKWNGFRVLRDDLEGFMERRPGRLRVLTTTYIGATDQKAVEALVEIGAHVKVSYATTDTRLHAKAWMFHRESGFSTAYIGSSNMSKSALLDGLEWNVRLSNSDNAPILSKFAAAFNQYWSDTQFETYEPERDRERFARALRQERHSRDSDSAALLAAVEVTARPHQQEILDELAAERARGHKRNLVVAATGTGKTVIAALDYRRLCKELSTGTARPTLLFVAHREEILRQSQLTFQLALRDSAFGERLIGGETPTLGRYVFASIQSLNEDRLSQIHPDAYDVVIVDEFHHAAAPTYDRLLTHLRPKILLGLTATPERTDGEPILQHFDHRVASDLRLWAALDQGLLSPFQYFGLPGPDISGVEWKRGHYDAQQLSNVYTADDALAMRVLQEVHDKVVDVGRMRALGFCVDVAHAAFMADRFNRAGVAAQAVSGKSGSEERRSALVKLSAGEVQVLFSVEIFNEGVDLPDVDTILFLRPTESSTLFLQQLGRGLRRTEGKSCCTVFDFIGNAHRRFRFDQRFRAIVGGTRRHVQRQVEQGFPFLPSGCSIVLERTAQKAVLDNIQHQLGIGQRGLVEDLRDLGPDTSLDQFLNKTGFELEDVYERSGCSFADLRRKAGFSSRTESAGRRRIERAIARLLHIDDEQRVSRFHAFLSAASAPPADRSDPMQRMLFVLLGFLREPLSAMDSVWALLWEEDDLRAELLTLLALLRDRSRRLTVPLPSELATLPFEVHATYSQVEVFAGFSELTSKDGIMRNQQGVYYFDQFACDAFFVTIDKNEADYTPTTLYQDYPLSPTVFHWESQSTCHEGTPTGQRYLQILPGSGNRALLFVRQQKRDERGITMPYLLLGPVSYRNHTGGRPMQIEWQLAHPMPARDFQEMKVAAG